MNTVLEFFKREKVPFVGRKLLGFKEIGNFIVSADSSSKVSLPRELFSWSSLWES